KDGVPDPNTVDMSTARLDYWIRPDFSCGTKTCTQDDTFIACPPVTVNQPKNAHAAIAAKFLRDGNLPGIDLLPGLTRSADPAYVPAPDAPPIINTNPGPNCGDGVVEPPEQCDQGVDNGKDCSTCKAVGVGAYGFGCENKTLRCGDSGQQCCDHWISTQT